MKPSKYVVLDQESIRRDFKDFFDKNEGEYMITAVPGTRIDLSKLAMDEKVCYGDGKSFHFKLKRVKP